MCDFTARLSLEAENKKSLNNHSECSGSKQLLTEQRSTAEVMRGLVISSDAKPPAMRLYPTPKHVTVQTLTKERKITMCFLRRVIRPLIVSNWL